MSTPPIRSFVVWPSFTFTFKQSSRLRLAVRGWSWYTVERLRFRIDHNETVASDISEVLSSIHLPRMQRAVRTRMTPQYLDLQLGLRQSNDAEQLSRK